MTRLRRRSAAALVLPLLLLPAACDGGDAGDPARDEAPDATTTTSSAAAGSGETTTSAVGVDGSSTTAAATATTSAPATSAPPAAGGGDEAGVIELTITGGNVEGGVRRETVKQGAQVTIRATSDTADELHVHTYDLKVDLVPGQSADITFLAKVPGVFEVELEKRRKKVLELEVRP